MMGNKKVLLTASSIGIAIVTQNPGATQFSDLVITASTPLTRGLFPTELQQGERFASSEPSPSTRNPWDILHR
jgi:hypothetical protein